jgi:uncharacterized protein
MRAYQPQADAVSRSVIALLTAAGVLIAAMMLLLWSMQERIAYQPPAQPPSMELAGTMRVDYTAADGQPLFGFMVGDPGSAAGVLLAFHGNADVAAWQLSWAEDVVTRTGYAVFLPEYRGYMGLPGRPTYAGLRLDARAAYQFLRDSLRVDARAIAMFGHSLGTAVAAELASEQQPRALLLQSPFTSSRDMASRMVSLPVATLLQFVTRIPYDTRARVGRVEAPTWVIHGKRDLIVPARMGRSVFDAVKHKGGFVVIEGAGHNDVGAVDQDRYWKWMAAALGSYREAAAL